MPDAPCRDREERAGIGKRWMRRHRVGRSLALGGRFTGSKDGDFDERAVVYIGAFER
jgi:hypothetical protein